MGNACSRQQPDSVRVQENNSSDKQSDFLEPEMDRIDGAPNTWGIYKQVYKIDGIFTITIFVNKDKFHADGTIEKRIIPVCFFKMDQKPSRIGFNLSAEGTFSITAYSCEKVIHSISWEATEYDVREKDGVFLECVKKIQRTDCSSIFVSDLHPKSLTAQFDSHVVFESYIDERVSASQTDVHQLSDNERLRQIAMTYGVSEKLLRKTILPLFDDVAQSGSQIDESAHSLEVDHRKVFRQSGIVSASHSPATDIRINQRIVVLVNVCVGDVNLLVRIPIPSTVIESMIKFFRAVGPNVLGTVSLLINQLVRLLQLDYKPSETDLVLSDALCDNGRIFLTSMFHQMRRNISLLERLASSEDSSGWEIVECIKRVEPSVEVVSSNRSASSSLDLVSSKSPDQLRSRQDFYTENDGVNVVKKFSDTKHTYTVLPNRIEFSIGHDIFFVNFGIPSDSIKKIIVYEMMKGVVLIVIHTVDHQVYLSGHSGTSTSPIFVKAQITTHVSVGQPNLFESIEFDSSNSLHFHINMTNSKKFFAINNQDGSIRQLGCQLKKL